MMHSAHIRGARALLGWRQTELADRAKVGLATIQRLERGPPGPVMAQVSTIMKIEECLKEAGVMFLDSDPTGGIGVRLIRR